MALRVAGNRTATPASGAGRGRPQAAPPGGAGAAAAQAKATAGAHARPAAPKPASPAARAALGAPLQRTPSPGEPAHPARPAGAGRAGSPARHGAASAGVGLADSPPSGGAGDVHDVRQLQAELDKLRREQAAWHQKEASLNEQIRSLRSQVATHKENGKAAEFADLQRQLQERRSWEDGLRQEVEAALEEDRRRHDGALSALEERSQRAEDQIKGSEKEWRREVELLRAEVAQLGIA